MLMVLPLLDDYRQAHSWVNRAIDVVRASSCERSDLDARPAQLQVLECRNASRRLGLRCSATPLAIVQDVERSLVLDDLQRAALA